MPLLRRGWIVVLAVVVCVVAAYGYEARRQAEYQSTVILQPSSSASTVALVPTNPLVVSSAASFLHTTSAQAAAVAGDVSISQDPSSGLIYVSAVDAQPAGAVRRTTAFGEAYISALREQARDTLSSLQKESTSLAQTISTLTKKQAATTDKAASALITAQLTATSESYGSVESQIVAIETAPPPASIYSEASAATRTGTGKKKVIGLAALVGLLAGCGLLLARERLDVRVRSAAELAAEVPIVEDLPYEPSTPKERANVLAVLDSPATAFADGVRELRTALQSGVGDRPSSVVLVTSAQTGDGGTVLAANLAASWALAGRRVVAVSTDLRRPRLEPLLGAGKAAVGLSTLLSTPSQELIHAGERAERWADLMDEGAVPGKRRRGGPSDEQLESALVDTRVPGLVLLPAGPAVGIDPGDLLAGESMQHVVLGLREHFDVVVVDTPAMASTSDAGAVASLADGVVVVARGRSTNRRALRRTIGRLRTVGARVVAVVVNVPNAPTARGHRPALLRRGR